MMMIITIIITPRCRDIVEKLTVAQAVILPQQADENFTLLGFDTASSGNFLKTFRDNTLVSSSGFKSPEDGTDRLNRSIGNRLPLLAA